MGGQRMRAFRAVAMGVLSILVIAAVPAPPLPARRVPAESAESAALKAAPEPRDHYDFSDSFAFSSPGLSGRVAWVSGSSRNAPGLLTTVDERGRVTSKIETGKIHQVLTYPAPRNADHAAAGFAGMIQVSGGGTGFHQETFSLHDPAEVNRRVFSQTLYELQWHPTGPNDRPGGRYSLRRSTFAVTPERITESRVETVAVHGGGNTTDWQEPEVTVRQYAWNSKKQKYLAIEPKIATVVEFAHR